MENILLEGPSPPLEMEAREDTDLARPSYIFSYLTTGKGFSFSVSLSLHTPFLSWLLHFPSLFSVTLSLTFLPCVFGFVLL